MKICGTGLCNMHIVFVRTLAAIYDIWVPLKSVLAFASVTNILITIVFVCWVDTRACTASANACIHSELLLRLLTAKIGYCPVLILSDHWTGLERATLHMHRSAFDSYGPFTDIDVRRVGAIPELIARQCHVSAFKLEFFPCGTAFT